MAFTPGKGHHALRRGRWSQNGAEYFLTLCTSERQRGLTSPASLAAIDGQLATLEAEQIWHVRTATVMPDHLHLLVVLGKTAQLSSSVRLFKGRLSPALRAVGVRWERGYFDHRMRPDEDRRPIFLYIFMNPYRKNLVKPGQSWVGYLCSADDWEWFGPLTDKACPFPEWLL